MALSGRQPRERLVPGHPEGRRRPARGRAGAGGAALLLRHLGGRAESPALDRLRAGARDATGTLCTVRIRPGMAKSDTLLVAALVSSEVARARARCIFPSLIASHRLLGVAYPKAYPPFDGPADLGLAGLWLRPGRRFLALEILYSNLPVRAERIARVREVRRSRRLDRATTAPAVGSSSRYRATSSGAASSARCRSSSPRARRNGRASAAHPPGTGPLAPSGDARSLVQSGAVCCKLPG